MNSLSLGFLYLIGLTWLLCEVCVSASGGNWTPLWIYLAGFIVMFAILGCLPLRTKTIETAGPIFALLIGGWILLYAFGSFDTGVAGVLFRLALGAGMVGVGILGYATRRSEEAH